MIEQTTVNMNDELIEQIEKLCDSLEVKVRELLNSHEMKEREKAVNLASARAMLGGAYEILRLIND